MNTGHKHTNLVTTPTFTRIQPHAKKKARKINAIDILVCAVVTVLMNVVPLTAT